VIAGKYWNLYRPCVDESAEALERRIDELRSAVRQAVLAGDRGPVRDIVLLNAAAALAERLLPVLDDAERAMAHVPEGVEEGWLKGLQMTVRKLEEILGSVGVERIEAEGKPFDPNLHEAIGSEESEETDEDTVTAELRPGYRMHDRVLRPALVRVSRRPG